MATKIMIDPPYGHRYGFPREIPEGVKDTKGWLLSCGYPQKEIDACGDHFYCNFWVENDENDENEEV